MVLFTSAHCPLLSPTHFGCSPRTRTTGKHTTEFSSPVQQGLAAADSYVGWPAVNLMKRLAWCRGHKCRSWGLAGETVGDCKSTLYRIHQIDGGSVLCAQRGFCSQIFWSDSMACFVEIRLNESNTGFKVVLFTICWLVRTCVEDLVKTSLAILIHQLNQQKPVWTTLCLEYTTL